MGKNLIDIFLTGGWTMIPLFLCSILSLAIILERFFSLQERKIIPNRVVELIEKNQKPEDISKELLSKNPSPVEKLIALSLSQKNLSKEQNSESLELAGRLESHRFENGLLLLEIIAVVAPLLGLLGTVLGMYDLFIVISQKGAGLAKEFSGGISKALITTIVGLIIAIPTLIAHSFFSRKIEALVLNMETCLGLVLSKLYPESKKS